MKKLTLTMVSVLAITGAAFAQGTVQWNAFVPTAITAQTNAAVLSPLFGGGPGTGTTGLTAGGATSFYYELLYNTAFTGSQVAAPTTLAGLATWQDAGLRATNTLIAGRVLPITPSTQAALPAGWPGGIGALGGTTNNIMLVGWSANLGTSWLAVSNILQNWTTLRADYSGSGTNSFFGLSATGYLVPNTGNPGATVFAIAANGNGLPILSLLTPLYVLPVPEPTTIALIGLGGLSLLLFRRRQ